jgi:hypothetical protein
LTVLALSYFRTLPYSTVVYPTPTSPVLFRTLLSFTVLVGIQQHIPQSHCKTLNQDFHVRVYYILHTTYCNAHVEHRSFAQRQLSG